jgi:hypothetical protein
VYRVGSGSWTLFRLFPPWFYNNLDLKFQLAKGLGYHFFFMWFFALNGVAYVLYTLLSGEWRDLAPNRRSFAEAIEVILHDLGLRTTHRDTIFVDSAQTRKSHGNTSILSESIEKILIASPSGFVVLSLHSGRVVNEGSSD